MDSVIQDLYDKYHRDLYQFIFYMVKNHETAEDIVQEVYIRVMKSYGRFEGKSSEKTWLFSIARNAAIDHYRKSKGWKQRLLDNFDWERQSIRDTGPVPEEIAVQNSEIQSVYRCLSACSLDQQSVIILRYIQGMPISETAAILDWSESKVKTTQHRALKAIKKMMAAEIREGGESIEKI